MKNKNTLPVAAGIALTMAAAGSVAYMMNNSKGMNRQKKQLKRQAIKAVDNISHWADTINSFMG